jgi:hypothetical protein
VPIGLGSAPVFVNNPSHEVRGKASLHEEGLYSLCRPSQTFADKSRKEITA